MRAKWPAGTRRQNRKHCCVQSGAYSGGVSAGSEGGAGGVWRRSYGCDRRSEGLERGFLGWNCLLNSRGIADLFWWKDREQNGG